MITTKDLDEELEIAKRMLRLKVVKVWWEIMISYLTYELLANVEPCGGQA